MEDFRKEIKEKTARMGCEMKGLAQDMGNEMRGIKEIIKEKAEKLGDDIKRRITRWITKTLMFKCSFAKNIKYLYLFLNCNYNFILYKAY